ncbi:ubiquinone biosynthesis monooxygenase COQ6, mitochondrial isoform X2 [Phalaenopsis equestris]|uniref:ubiquinone biosynthesis monooxygenase COQ6, mitochondrial isoform X2 n=1 Tax=Phalaenopsis equestris TaxID=78828 RepID=UPI0009E39567|nr:ubiquinone biosynthesis monooxygenase COQ6, mitochondrial isoform X2 [Phalaenopsis equestris]
MSLVCKPRVFLNKALSSIRSLNSMPKRSFSDVESRDGSNSNSYESKFSATTLFLARTASLGYILANCSLQLPYHLRNEVMSSTKTKDEEYDIAIVGGGMVGLALACGLASMQLTKELSVAIIDNNPALISSEHYKKHGVPYPRVSTVTPATLSFFKEVGAWKYIEQQRHAYFDQMQVWDYSGLGYTRYHARDVGNEYLGCVVENMVLCDALLSCLQNLDFQMSIHNARITSMKFPSPFTSTTTSKEQMRLKGDSSGFASSGYTVEPIHNGSFVKLGLSNAKNIYAKLVVGADGAKSHVREKAGLNTTGWNYRQNAVICTVEHSVENHCAWQRFLPSGPIALLPIGDKFSNIVWTMSPEESLTHKTMSRDSFVMSVNFALDYGYGSHPQSSFLDEFVHRISSISGHGTASMAEPFQVPPEVTDVVSERMTFPLSLMHAREYASERVVLIGDAAHAVHPLAGQGVNLGFGDAATLSKVIDEGLQVGADIGELSLLKKYEKERKAVNLTMMAVLDGFQKAYSMDFGPLNFLRAAAFHSCQFIAPLKRNILSYAMGEQKWPLFTWETNNGERNS